VPPSDEEAWVYPFVSALEQVRLRDDRATLAKLRRGLTSHPAERDIWVYWHLRGAASRHEDSALLLASLFALHPKPNGAGSLGAAFRRIRTDSTSESLNKRFAMLLDSHRDDLPDRLRQAVSLLKSKDVAVHWRQLLLDLLDWERVARPVQRRWARDYWVPRPTGADSDEVMAANISDGENTKTKEGE
jgi:CRISPR type I-E-associated protein CasB/Cse2